jgi:transcriptional regulator with XRE-family HTH domain
MRLSKLYERVREARRMTKLSQEALALDLEVSRSAVAQWEMAHGTSPSVENLIALARRSGLAFEYLATGRGTKVFGPPVTAIEQNNERHSRLSEQQRRLLDRFEMLNPKQRIGLIEFLGKL